MKNQHVQSSQSTDEQALKTWLNCNIRLLLQGKIIPTSCKILVLQLWPSALFRVLKSQGEHSQPWHNAYRMYTELLDSLQPVDSLEQYNELKSRYMQISRSNNNLLLLYHPEEKVEPAIKSLIKFFNTQVRQSSFAQAAMNMQQINANQTSVQSATALQSRIRPGRWCEVYIDESSPTKNLRLFFIDTDNGRLIFTDRNGIKALEKDATEFSRELRKGLSRTIDDYELIGRQPEDTE